MTFPALYIYNVLLFAYKCKQEDPNTMRQAQTNYSLRNASNLSTTRTRLKASQDFVEYCYPKYFNALPEELKLCPRFKPFQAKVKQYLLARPLYSFAEFFRAEADLTLSGNPHPL